VVNGLALTCKSHVWHSWEDPKTATGAHGICCKPAHTVHVVNNFYFNFSFGEDEFTAAVRLHPTDTKESADVLSRARGHVGGVQCMYRAVNKLARGKPNRNSHLATALNVDSDPTHARGSGGGGECNEVTSKRS
jgi:hypothetical protein